MSCEYGDYSCEADVFNDNADYSAEQASEEEVIDDSWYANTTLARTVYWVYGITHLWYLLFGVMLYTWYPNLIRTD